MRRKSLSIILCLVIAATGYGQINFSYLQADSLRLELSRVKHDTSRVLLFANLAEGYRWSNPDSAMYFGQKALNLAKQIKFPKGEASALSSISVVQRELGNLARALDLATTALSITQRYQYRPEEITALIRIANVYSSSKNFDKALIYLHQAEDKSGEIGNVLVQNISQWLIAAAFEQMNKLDSAWYYADKAFQNLTLEAGADFAYNILGDIQLKLKKDSLALQSYKVGLVEAERVKDFRTAANLNISLANYYKKHNKIDSAIYYAKEALAVAQFLSYKNRIISSSSILAQLYESKDAGEALKYYKILNTAKESLYGAEKMQALQTLMMDEQEKQKKAEAATLAYRNRVRQYALIGGLLFFSVVMLLLYRNNRRKEKANTLLQKQKQEIEERKAQAEIETALEKVRTIAMGMRKPDDMLEICKTISQQLDLLQVKEIRNVQTAIFYEDQGTYMNYEYYAMHDKQLATEVGFKAHPAQYEFAYKMLRGPNEFFTLNLEGQKLKDWYEYQKTTPQFADSFLETASSLNYYWYSMGPVALGLSTYTPLSEQQIVLFKRFRNVFELSYRRYLDIEKAVAQAREAQIEAALERVRSRTIGMQKSEELQSAALLLFQQIEALGARYFACGFNIWDEDRKTATAWMAREDVIQPPFKTSSSQDVFLKIYEAAERGESLFVEEQCGEKLELHYRYMASIPVFKSVMEKMTEAGLSVPTFQIIHCAFFSQGYLMFISFDPVPEAHDIFKRFAKVFEQTYTRFLDLQKAEAQAREATIESALEKVRGKAMSMHNSNDLSVTASMVFMELRKLGINPIRCGVGLLNKESRKAQLYSAASSPDGDSFSLVGWVLLERHPVLEKIYDIWQKKEDYFPELTGEQLKHYYELLLAGLPVNLPDWHDGQKQYGHFFSFSIGCLYVWSETPYNDAEIRILKRFASIIDLTFRRYLDLQKSEASTKEAIKQAALDRIRADIASMRTVDDLDRIIPLVWNELTTLGVPFIRCGVFIMKNDEQQIHTFLSTPHGKAIAAFHLQYNTKGKISQVLKHWQNNETYIEHWNEDAFREFANSLVEQGALKSSKQYLSTLPAGGFYLQFVPFLQGMLYVGTGIELGDDEIKLLHSVAGAFSTAYARYEDFNKLEGAKKEVEKTLEELKLAQTQLVQSEKMASLGELTAGIAHEIQNPLNFVNNFSEVSSELLDEIKSELDKGDIAEAKSIADDVKQNLEKITHHGKRADAIVKSMLQHSRKSSGQKDPIDINALVDEYLRLSYHGFRAKDKFFNAITETHFDPAVGKIDVIGQDIGRVLLNLFNNAFYAVTEKKKQQQNGFEPIIQVSTTKLKEGIQIKIKDNGIGIANKVLEKIYQPFFTTKPTGEGTGLGLSLSYDIITKGHSGELKVETQEGQGSEFIIQLPVNQ